MTSFIFIINQENWEIIHRESIMGVSGRWGKWIYSKLQIGDKCVIYIKGISCIAGIYKIKTLKKEVSVKWNTGTYGDIFKIDPVIIPKSPVPINNYIEKLNFVKNKKKWFSHFQHHKFFPDSDIEFLIQILKET